MSKYIIALLFPWLSFFMRKKIINGVICIIFSTFIMAVMFMFSEQIAKHASILFGLRITGVIPNLWALYSIRQSNKTLDSDKISELS